MDYKLTGFFRRYGIAAAALTLSLSSGGVLQAQEINRSVAAVFLGEVHVGNFDPTAYAAWEKMLSEHDFERSEFAEAVPFEQGVETLTDFARRGFGLIIAHSEGYQAAVHRVAAEFPDTHFVISPAGETGGLPNVSVYRENPFHVLLLPGMVAGLTSTSGKIGYVGAVPLPGILKEGGGYVAGAKLANPDIAVDIVWTNSFEDAGRAKEAALAMYQAGADVVGHTVDTASQGIFQAAAETGNKAIGGFADEGLTSSVVLTSGIYNDDLVWGHIANDYLSGTIEGKVYEFGLCEDGVKLGSYNDVPEDIQARIQQTRDSICSGELVLEEAALPSP